MITRTPVSAVRLGGRPDQPLLLLGPDLGTSAQALWAAAAVHLAEHFQVVAWDLPGHGTNRTPLEAPVTVAGLAAGVLEAVDAMGRGLQPPTFHYAGAGVGAAVGLQLLLDAPARVESATLLGAGAVAPDPLPERPAAAADADDDADDEGYAAVRAALAGFDVRRRLGRIATPVLVAAGADDATTPVASLREVADGVQDGRLEVVAGAGRLVPVDAPAEVARLVREHAFGPAATALEDMTTRFEAAVADVWGAVASRPGLDPRSRSLVTLTALVVGGHHDRLAQEVPVALEQGVGVEEITELLVQAAVLCGVPAAEAALRTVRTTLAELGEG
ncbi:3-oxoadipate enol-lactonase/4-carboxymuconolactone decarboxylase [Nocardioides marinisabuli]|uniref:3-oxoadipate enol-lactonase/4-carboxymuconolactone decarboxylase n=1 Tax=Nocardioides marinisabuli TaxID=419476 RepID=A0A7Y9F0K7_9ACTN|nr:alpha/beta fold hydrolase [Nocardioides marinisabuli]NYD57404.1 3-oxoadipate enol-lactonase/4-carboxymuconolactone decarboxylase [Nocardioides marinisabuli]